MTQIQQKIHKFINKNLEIQRAIKNEIISNRKLAIFILKTLELNSNNIEATISAIRRYKTTPNNQTQNLYKLAHQTIKNTKIITKSDIVTIVIEKDNDASKILPQLFSKINYNKGEVLRIMQAEESIKIVIDKQNLEKIKTIIPKNKIINIQKDLAEINLILDKNAVNTPGILTTIFSELTINKVNLMEAVSCVPEMLLFLKEKDLLLAYSVLFNLIKN